MITGENMNCLNPADHEAHPWRDHRGLEYVCGGYSAKQEAEHEAKRAEIRSDLERVKADYTALRERESAASGPSPTPSETRQDRIRRAAAWIRSDAEWQQGQPIPAAMAGLLDASASAPYVPIDVIAAADALARSILGEPGDDR